MMRLTRREVFVSAAAASAATLVAPIIHSTAYAAALPTGRQVPSYYRYKVGSFEVTAVTDGVRIWPLDNL